MAAEHPGRVALVGMDAFHLAQRVLDRSGLAAVKGAPRTFDADGYVALLRRLRSAPGTVYAPEFLREIEDSIAGNVEVSAQVQLVITEGNYLLVPEPPWSEVRPLLDEAWFVHLDEAVRHQRLAARHESFGHDPDSAVAKTRGSDEANARLVNTSQNRPDLWVDHEPRPRPDTPHSCG